MERAEAQEKTIFRNASRAANFVQLPNDLVRDASLSFKARGVLCMLLSNIDTWKVHVGWIEEQGTEGREAVQGAVRELEAAGYMSHQQRQRELGKFSGSVWTVYDTPLPIGERTNRTKWQGEVFKNSAPSTGSHQREAVTGEPSTANRERLTDAGLSAAKNTKVRTPTAEHQEKKTNAIGGGSELFNETVEPDFPAGSMMRSWNTRVPSLTKINGIVGKRAKSARARYKDLGGTMADWDAWCDRIEKADKLTGRFQGHKPSQWVASFDWCIEPANFLKITEGKYDPQKPTPTHNNDIGW